MAVILNREDEENGQSTTGQSSVIGGSTPDGQSKATGTGWTNLQKYLQANEGQGAGIANTVTSYAARQAQEPQPTTTQTAPTQQPAGSTSTSGLGPSAWQNLASYWGGDSTSTGGTIGIPDEAKDYDNQKAMLNEVYKGAPKSGQYTSGMGALDAFIMRGDDAGQKAFEDAKNRRYRY